MLCSCNRSSPAILQFQDKMRNCMPACRCYVRHFCYHPCTPFFHDSCRVSAALLDDRQCYNTHRQLYLERVFRVRQSMSTGLPGSATISNIVLQVPTISQVRIKLFVFEVWQRESQDGCDA